jgi:hypothetical protein
MCNIRCLSKGIYVEKSPSGKGLVALADGRQKGKRVLSPQDMGCGEKFTKTGSPYSGSVLAYIIKSVQKAQSGSPVAKRKNRDDVSDQNDMQIPRRKIRVVESRETTSGNANPVCLDDKRIECNNGSGMAAAGFQPRRPQ